MTFLTVGEKLLVLNKTIEAMKWQENSLSVLPFMEVFVFQLWWNSMHLFLHVRFFSSYICMLCMNNISWWLLKNKLPRCGVHWVFQEQIHKWNWTLSDDPVSALALGTSSAHLFCYSGLECVSLLLNELFICIVNSLTVFLSVSWGSRSGHT